MDDESDTPPASPDRPATDADAAGDETPPEPNTAETEPDPSSARARFLSCRFHAEDGDEEYCSNRDVLPYAGRHAFNAEAWCPECNLYKLRRTPKKRSRDAADDDYPY